MNVNLFVNAKEKEEYREIDWKRKWIIVKVFKAIENPRADAKNYNTKVAQSNVRESQILAYQLIELNKMNNINITNLFKSLKEHNQILFWQQTPVVLL